MNIWIILVVVVLQATCRIAAQLGNWSSWSACTSGWIKRTRSYTNYWGQRGSSYEKKSCDDGGGGSSGRGGGSSGTFKPTGGEPRSAEELACLVAHNKYRRALNKPDLIWDAGIARSARNWAKQQVGFGQLVHTKKPKYGENLAYSSYPNAGGKAAVKGWYDEICMYNSCNPAPSSTWHFTQVVWQSSKYLGCGVAKEGSNVYTVGQYYPKGNYLGQFCKNVGLSKAYQMSRAKDRACR